ncbi:MAG: hypothetical protein HY876_09605 [Coriobacteriales bacterium]|nr:hypothetical protein [Coriobacteriales bacterium]
MNRFVTGALSVGLVAALLAIAALAMQVGELKGEVAQTRAAATRAARAPSYPLVVDGRSPAVSFSDERSLAQYVVRVHDDVEALSAALERDIHASEAAGQAGFANTHAAIDGAQPPEAPRASDSQPASNRSEPYLGYHE